MLAQRPMPLGTPREEYAIVCGRVCRDCTPGDPVGVCRSYRPRRLDDGVLPVFHGRDPTEVALLVRLELEQPGMLTGGSRKQVPTLEAVEHALWLFAEGIEE